MADDKSRRGIPLSIGAPFAEAEPTNVICQFTSLTSIAKIDRRDGPITVPLMAAKTIQVSLPGQLRGYIERNINGGRYHDASEVVRAALRHMETSELASELAQFDRAIAGGHERAETQDDIRRVERAVKGGRKK